MKIGVWIRFIMRHHSTSIARWRSPQRANCGYFQYSTTSRFPRVENSVLAVAAAVHSLYRRLLALPFYRVSANSKKWVAAHRKVRVTRRSAAVRKKAASFPPVCVHGFASGFGKNLNFRELSAKQSNASYLLISCNRRSNADTETKTLFLGWNSGSHYVGRHRSSMPPRFDHSWFVVET
jgi:hypothetical protein